MTTDAQINKPNRPVYRIGFAPYEGQDQPKLGYPVEIGACFSRKQADKGLIAKFKLFPADMIESGVLLLLPPNETRSENHELNV